MDLGDLATGKATPEQAIDLGDTRGKGPEAAIDASQGWRLGLEPAFLEEFFESGLEGRSHCLIFAFSSPQ
jgi:hypothetical protein